MSWITLGQGILRSRMFGNLYSANFKITERCNLRCPMCGIWRHGSRQKELSIEQIAVGARNLKKLGIARVVLTGGEPLVRKDVCDIIRIFAKQNISTTLLTNGLLGRDILLQNLFEAGLDHIGISLDFINPEKQDAFYSQKGAWQQIVSTIHSAISRNKRGFVYVMTTLVPENILEIVPLFGAVQQWGAHFIVNPVMGSAPREPDRVFSGITTPPLFTEEQLKAVEVLYTELIRLKKKGHKILASERYLRESLYCVQTGDLAWPCHAGQFYVNIFSDGGVAPCNEYKPILSLVDPEFITSIQSPFFQDKAREIRESARAVIWDAGGKCHIL